MNKILITKVKHYLVFVFVLRHLLVCQINDVGGTILKVSKLLLKSIKSSLLTKRPVMFYTLKIPKDQTKKELIPTERMIETSKWCILTSIIIWQLIQSD